MKKGNPQAHDSNNAFAACLGSMKTDTVSNNTDMEAKIQKGTRQEIGQGLSSWEIGIRITSIVFGIRVSEKTRYAQQATDQIGFAYFLGIDSEMVTVAKVLSSNDR